nr:uncharacterized protein LOC116776470 [Danaus plexippus plexippus]
MQFIGDMSRSVTEFYDGKCIFVTGATGFVGKVLVEKILRSLPGVKNVYLLMRQKKGTSGDDRLKDLWNSRIFDNLRANNPDAFNKIKLISGDLLKEDLGICNDDRGVIQENCNIVFHSAACVRFDQKLKDAVETNTTATLRLLKLAETMKFSKSQLNPKRRKQKTIQISLFNAWFGLGAGPNSTSWNAPLMITANGTNDPVTDIPPALATLRIDLASGEKYVNTYPHLMVLWYPGGNIRSYWITHQINLVLTHILPAYFIDFLLLLFRKKPLLISSEPNTYSYTKAITEDLVAEFSSKFPIAIGRPSIVTASWKEPMPGWVDNINGPTGLLMGSGKDDSRDSMTASRSLTETHRNADVGKTKLDRMALQFVRETEGNVPLVHVTFQQPNFYYRKRRKQKTIQISLFNAWFGLGAGPNSTSWNAPLMITANGTNDPVTDIPPALATLRIDLASGNQKSPKDVRIFNLTLSGVHKITWREVIELGEKYVNTYPHLMVLWYPGGNIRSYWITHQINLVLTHILPAYFIDFLLLLFRKKPL